MRVMNGSGDTYFVKKPAQLRALASGVRQEIIDVLGRLGTVSVAELAKALDRPAAGIYYHLSALVRVGLVRRAGVSGRRRQSVYRCVAPAVRIPAALRRSKPVVTIVGSLLRLGARDYRRATRRSESALPKDVRDLWALRAVGRLNVAQLARVNRYIRDMVAEVERPRTGGALYGLTVLLAPLARGGQSEDAA